MAAPGDGAVSPCPFNASSPPIARSAAALPRSPVGVGPAGGYGEGTIEYASLEMVQGQVTDDDIYAAVADVLPVAAIGWTRITN